MRSLAAAGAAMGAKKTYGEGTPRRRGTGRATAAWGKSLVEQAVRDPHTPAPVVAGNGVRSHGGASL